MAEIINESVDLYGVMSTASALELLEKARQRSALPTDQAMRLAVTETRAHRAMTPRQLVDQFGTAP